MIAALVAGAGRDIGPYLTRVGIIIGLVVVAALVLFKVRSRLLARDTQGGITPALFDDLRKMRDQGRITPEEYDAARKRMAARAAGKPAAPARPAPGEVRAPPGVDLTGAPLPRPDAPAPGDE